MSKTPDKVEIHGQGAYEAVLDYVTKFSINAEVVDDCAWRVATVTGPSAWAVGAAFANVGWEVRT